ncbi:MAG TPA: IPT/TIG domain-containing protein [Thermoanaerobaculia bacterium]
MSQFRGRKSWIVLIAILLLFAACKGESPTAPPPGGGVPPGSGTPPPTGASLALTATSLTPLEDSTVTITATATNNGAPVPNGTAVEFTSTGGVLDGVGQAVLKTTTNGAATVTLTSSSTGLVRVTAVVNNVSRTIDITFQAGPVIPPLPDTQPVITAVTPSVGRPQGGQLIRITGKNFKAPVRVLFNTGGPAAIEGSVQSVTDTAIEVITPPVNLGAGQQLAADVIVLTQAGTANEQRAELADGFTFENEQLEPVISTISPNSGPVTGGTRVTIFGEGFQDPVQVLFNTAEARVLTVQFDRIIVETPAARDTDPNGSGAVTGPVTVTVRNINSQTATTMPAGFHYKAAMQITAISPGSGSYLGGQRLTIDGIGFVPPVTVNIGEFAARVLEAYGTRVIVLTPAVDVEGCADVVGTVIVTNIANGDQAQGPDFISQVGTPLIVNVSPAVATVGVTTSVQVTVANAQPGVVRIQIGEKTVFPSGVVLNADGSATYTVPLPTNFEFPTEECPGGGERFVPIDVDVIYTNAETECTDTATQALTVNPPDSSCTIPEAPEANVTAPPAGACPRLTLNAGSGNQGTITVENTGTAPLTVSAAATPNASFTVLNPNEVIPEGESRNFIVQFNPAGGDSAGNVALTTDDEDEPIINICIAGDAP